MVFNATMEGIRGPSSQHLYQGVRLKPSRPNRWRKPLLTAVILLVCTLTFLAFWGRLAGFKVIQSSQANQGYPDFFEREMEFYRLHRITEHIVKEGETLHDCLLSKGIPADVAFRYIETSKAYLDPRLLRPGDRLKFLLEKDTNLLKKLVCARGTEEIFTVVKTPSGLVASKNTMGYVTRNAVGCGKVMNSLYEAGLKAGIDVGLILELADIFAWDIDFATDIRSGDTFKLVYEEYYKEGKWIKNGRILVAEFIKKATKTITVLRGDVLGNSSSNHHFAISESAHTSPDGGFIRF
jgi:hypothetical protein